MNRKRRLAIVTAGLMALGGVGTAAALGGSGNPPSPALISPAEHESGSDTDALEQGDQATADQSESEGEAYDEELSTGDGSGGHEDTGPDVEHEFEGAE